MESTIGARIALTRREQGLTQEELAEKLGVDTRTVQRIEQNDGSISVSRLLSVAKALGVPATTWINGEPSTDDQELLALVHALPSGERKVLLRWLTAAVRSKGG